MELRVSVRSYLQDRRGTTAIIFALALIPAVVLAGGTVDFGKLLSERAKLQAATDAATLGAAQLTGITAADRETIAKKIFRANISGSEFATLEPTVSATDTTVEVAAAGPVKTPFLGIINIPHLDAIASAKAEASELTEGVSPGKVCLLALDPDSDDGIHLQGANIVNYHDCWAHTNSEKATAINANGSNAKANGKGHCAVGGWTQTHATFTPEPTGACQVVKDPFATVGAYESGTYTPKFTPPTKAVTCKASNLNLKKGSFTLDPGRYCGGINIQAGATVTFNPGVYYIDNGPFNVQSGASASGSNVLFYLEGAASRMTVIGGGTINLVGRSQSASYAGFLVIANPNANPMGESNIQGGGTFKMQGVIYMPKQRIEVSGNGDVNNANINVFGMVAKDFYFRGNGVFNAKRHTGYGNVPDIMPEMPVHIIRKTVLN
jgi:hypothetical protein